MFFKAARPLSSIAQRSSISKIFLLSGLTSFWRVTPKLSRPTIMAANFFCVTSTVSTVPIDFPSRNTVTRSVIFVTSSNL